MILLVLLRVNEWLSLPPYQRQRIEFVTRLFLDSRFFWNRGAISGISAGLRGSASRLLLQPEFNGPGTRNGQSRRILNVPLFIIGRAAAKFL